MEIIKKIFKLVAYLFMLIIFCVIFIMEETTLFYGYTSILIVFIGYKIFKGTKKFKRKRIRGILSVITNILILFFVLVTSYIYLSSDGKGLKYIVEKRVEFVEKGKYNNEFEEIEYNKCKILYNSNNKEAIPLLKRYLDEIERENKDLFKCEKSSPLTIKLDYDKSIFKKRTKSNNSVQGYYIDEIKTIYIYSKDAYTILSDDYEFRDTFFHEYTHYYMMECFEANNSEKQNMPTWFDEGVASYMASYTTSSDKSVKGSDLEFIPFSEIKSNTDWQEIEDAKNYKQSEFMINKILDKKGKDVIVELILNMKENDFDAAYKDVIGTSLEEFEEEIKADIKSENEGLEYNYKSKESVDYSNEIVQGLEEYIENNIYEVKAYDLLAKKYYDKGKSEKSMEILNRGLSNNPNSSSLEFLLKYYSDK